MKNITVKLIAQIVQMLWPSWACQRGSQGQAKLRCFRYAVFVSRQRDSSPRPAVFTVISCLRKAHATMQGPKQENLYREGFIKSTRAEQHVISGVKQVSGVLLCTISLSTFSPALQLTELLCIRLSALRLCKSVTEQPVLIYLLQFDCGLLSQGTLTLTHIAQTKGTSADREGFFFCQRHQGKLPAYMIKCSMMHANGRELVRQALSSIWWHAAVTMLSQDWEVWRALICSCSVYVCCRLLLSFQPLCLSVHTILFLVP